MTAYGITNVGNVRKINQDAYVIKPLDDNRNGFILVCDGMGGANGGEVASKIAADTIMEEVSQKLDNQFTKDEAREAIINSFKKANNEILNKAKGNAELVGMGTTAVCAIANDDFAVVGNIGDSRAYILQEGKLKQITSDHSLVNDLVKKGSISPEDAIMHPQKNIITRALGVDASAEVDIFSVDIKENMYIMLCSDGLTNEVSDPEICYEILEGASLEKSCKNLISIAKKRGGHDNITVVLATL